MCSLHHWITEESYSVTGHMTRPHSASLVAHKAEEIHYGVELTDKAIKLISSCQLVINAVDEDLTPRLMETKSEIRIQEMNWHQSLKQTTSYVYCS